MTPHFRRALGFGLVGIGLIAAGVSAFLWLAPEKVVAQSRVHVERDPEATNAYNATFMQNEFELIQSDAILSKVATSLRLPDRWSVREKRKLQTVDVVALLKPRLELEPVRCTSLVSIKLTGADPKETVEIGDAIASAYCNYRAQDDRKEVAANVVSNATIRERTGLSKQVVGSSFLGLGAVLTAVGIWFAAVRRS